MAVIAGAFAFTSCEEEIDLGAAKVSFVEPAGLPALIDRQYR